VEGRGGKGGEGGGGHSQSSVRSEKCRRGAVRCGLYGGAQEACTGKAPPRLVGVGPVWGVASNETCRQEPSNCCLASGSLGRFGALTGLSLPGAPRARCGSWAVAQAPLLCSALRCAAGRRQKTARRAKWSGAEQGASSNKQQAAAARSREQGTGSVASRLFPPMAASFRARGQIA
jgi:hypothetical protein